MNTKLIFPAVLLSAVTMAAHTYGGPIGHHKPDLNNDGVVTTAELLQHRQARFEKMDLNGDGFVTEAETAEVRAKMAAQRQKMHEEKAKARFSKTDLNGDGMISAEEFASEADQNIKRLDADGDGEISRQEMHAAKREMRGA